jgi:hypothetical protein
MLNWRHILAISLHDRVIDKKNKRLSIWLIGLWVSHYQLKGQKERLGGADLQCPARHPKTLSFIRNGYIVQVEKAS